MITYVRVRHRRAQCRGRALFSGLTMVACTLTLMALAGPAHAATPGLYAYAASSTVSVIDTSTNSVYDSPYLGLNHRSSVVAVSPDGHRVYVLNDNEAPGTVSVLDATTDVKVAEYNAGGAPVDMALTPDGKTLYVDNSYETSEFTGNPVVLAIDTATGHVKASIPIDYGPQDVTASPDGSSIYVATYGGAEGKLFNISTATNTVTGTITGLNAPRDVAFAPNGATAYLASQRGDQISVIDTHSFAVTQSFYVAPGPPNRVAVSPNGAELYVVINPGGYGSVAVYNTTTLAQTDNIAVGDSPDSVAFTPDGTAAYVMNTNNDLNLDPPVPSTVSVIQTATPRAVTKTITVGFAGTDVAVSPVALSTPPIRGPVAVNDTYTDALGQTLTVKAPGVLANDTDPAGTALTAGSAGNLNYNGTATLHPDGSFTYTPFASYYQPFTETFTYPVTDARGATSSATVSINVVQPVPPPTSTKQCLHGGWKVFNAPAFTSEADCVKYVSKH